MEQLKKKVRIVPMTNEYLNDVAELERTCFSNPWSRNMLAEAVSYTHLTLPTTPYV